MNLNRMRKRTIRINPNWAIYLCVMLSCLVPRYISTFKVHMGINISLYTMAVVAVWFLISRSIVLCKRLEYYFFFVWAAFIILSIWRAEKLGVWAYYVDWILTAILFQQILIKNKDENTYAFIIKAMTDALFLHLLMGIYEVTTHSYLFEIGNVSKRLYGHVAIGMFHNLNDYATFITTMIPFAIYRFLKSKKNFEKLYCGFLTVCTLYFITVSESRGAILTLMVFVCGGIFMFARKSRKNQLITVGGLLAFAVALATNMGGVFSRIQELLISNTIDVTGNSDIARINLIRNGLYFLSETYGFGVGAGNLYKWLSERSIYNIGDLAFIHNWYVEVLVTFGVLFFAVYLVFHGRILHRLFSKRYGVDILKTTMFLSFVCFSIVSISSSSNMYSEWVWMYLVVISLFAADLKVAL